MQIRALAPTMALVAAMLSGCSGAVTEPTESAGDGAGGTATATVEAVATPGATAEATIPGSSGPTSGPTPTSTPESTGGGTSSRIDGYDDPFEASIVKAKVPENSDNHVTMDIAITDAKGRPVELAYAVELTARQDGAEPIDDPQNCQEEHYNDPEIPRGVYRCTVIVGGPGEWIFDATIYSGDGRQTDLKTVSTTISVPDALQLESLS